MGKAKKPQDTPAPDENGVDMERIKALMGPLPDESAPIAMPKTPKTSPTPEPSTAPEMPKASSKEITEAAEEANEAIKAMAPDLGKSAITKIVDEPVNPVDPSIFDETKTGDEGVAKDDPGTVLAVNDIVAQEGDVVLKAEDEAREPLEKVSPAKTGFRAKLSKLWSNRKVRWGIIGGLVALLALAVCLPISRYFILNTVGVRSEVGVMVLDNSTQLPLKNVTVTAGGATAVTDDNGNAKLIHAKLGKTTLHISKRAFRSVDQSVTLGWGSNPMGKFSLDPVGEQFTFLVTDFLTGKPIEKAEATGSGGDAISDKTGKITLTLDTSGKAETDKLSITVSLSGYRDENVDITPNTKDTTKVKMVTAQKDVYVSNRSGKYDIYTIDIDGKNDKKIVSGNGLEQSNMALVPLENSSTAAYAATRENVRNSDGYLLTTLYFVDEETGDLTKVDQSEQIQIIGWSSGGRLVYIKIAAGSSSGNPKRYRLISLNSKNTSDSKELASANYFNDVVMAGDQVLYAPGNALKDTSPGLYSINSDGNGLIKVTDKDTYNIFRTDYNTVTTYSANQYYSYTIGSTASSFAATSTPSTTNNLYIDNQAGTKSIWLDSRDGKGVLLSYDKAAKKDITVTSVGGLKLPIRWLTDNIVVYRLSDGKDTADYAVSTDGGQPVKITELTDIGGVNRWYYY